MERRRTYTNDNNSEYYIHVIEANIPNSIDNNNKNGFVFVYGDDPKNLGICHLSFPLQGLHNSDWSIYYYNDSKINGYISDVVQFNDKLLLGSQNGVISVDINSILKGSPVAKPIPLGIYEGSGGMSTLVGVDNDIVVYSREDSNGTVRCWYSLDGNDFIEFIPYLTTSTPTSPLKWLRKNPSTGLLEFNDGSIGYQNLIQGYQASRSDFINSVKPIKSDITFGLNGAYIDNNIVVNKGNFYSFQDKTKITLNPLPLSSTPSYNNMQCGDTDTLKIDNNTYRSQKFGNDGKWLIYESYTPAGSLGNYTQLGYGSNNVAIGFTKDYVIFNGYSDNTVNVTDMNGNLIKQYEYTTNITTRGNRGFSKKINLELINPQKDDIDYNDYPCYIYKLYQDASNRTNATLLKIDPQTFNYEVIGKFEDCQVSVTSAYTFNSTMVVSVDNQCIAFVDTNDQFYLTRDGGKTWNIRSTQSMVGSTTYDQKSYLYASDTLQYMYMLYNNWLYKSSNFGESWTRVSTTKMSHVAVSGNGKYVIASAYSNGSNTLLVSTNYGTNFSKKSNVTIKSFEGASYLINIGSINILNSGVVYCLTGCIGMSDGDYINNLVRTSVNSISTKYNIVKESTYYGDPNVQTSICPMLISQDQSTIVSQGIFGFYGIMGYYNRSFKYSSYTNKNVADYLDNYADTVSIGTKCIIMEDYFFTKSAGTTPTDVPTYINRNVDNTFNSTFTYLLANCLSKGCANIS